MEKLVAQLSLEATNIIHSVMGMLELISDQPLSIAQAGYVRASTASMDRLHRALRDLSELTGARPVELEQSAFDVSQVIAGTAGVMGSLATARNLRFKSVQEPSTPVYVLGDAGRVEDILVRLLDSAIRSTNHGDVAIQSRIVASGPDTVSVEVSVSDSGPGILSDGNDAFLDPASLGLAIVRQLLARMGGTMSVDAQAGIGLRVSFVLPMSNAPQPAGSRLPLAVPNAEAGPLRPLELLVAEDSDDSYILVEAFLKGHGHKLSRAVDGEQALELFRQRAFDFVLMDICMPIMDGFAATRAMRDFETAAGRRRVPIVVLSAEETAVQVRMGAAVGCTGYLKKPVSKATLVGALQRWVPHGDD